MCQNIYEMVDGKLDGFTIVYSCLSQCWFFQKSNDPTWNDYWMPKLYVDNSVSEIKDTVWHAIVRNENNEAYISERRRLKAVFLENMELNEFPFDTQVS